MTGEAEARRRAAVARRERAERLDLSGLGLRLVPSEVWGLTGLKELWLGGNGLSAIPADVARLAWLECLYLDGNPIREVSEVLGGLRALRRLDLRGHRLVEVPGWLHDMARRGVAWLEGEGAPVEDLDHLSNHSNPFDNLLHNRPTITPHGDMPFDKSKLVPFFTEGDFTVLNTFPDGSIVLLNSATKSIHHLSAAILSQNDLVRAEWNGLSRSASIAGMFRTAKQRETELANTGDALRRVWQAAAAAGAWLLEAWREPDEDRPPTGVVFGVCWPTRQIGARDGFTLVFFMCIGRVYERTVGRIRRNLALGIYDREGAGPERSVPKDALPPVVATVAFREERRTLSVPWVDGFENAEMPVRMRAGDLDPDVNARCEVRVGGILVGRSSFKPRTDAWYTRAWHTVPPVEVRAWQVPTTLFCCHAADDAERVDGCRATLGALGISVQPEPSHVDAWLDRIEEVYAAIDAADFIAVLWNKGAAACRFMDRQLRHAARDFEEEFRARWAFLRWPAGDDTTPLPIYPGQRSPFSDVSEWESRPYLPG